MTDGAQQNGGNVSQLAHDTVRQRFLGAQETLSAQVVVGVLELERKFLRRRVHNLDRLAHHFRPGPVPAYDCNMVAFHELSLPSLPAGCAGVGWECFNAGWQRNSPAA